LSERDVFGRSPVPVVTGGEATALDREARDRAGIPGRLLMENAGRSAAQIVERLFPRGRVIAAVGSGHNGGDGLVLLRTLRAWGREVAYLPVGSRPPDPALVHGYDIPALELGAADATAATGTAPAPDADHLRATLAGADLLVDAILGTGTTGAPRGSAATVIGALNSSGRPVLALDLPSGVDPTTGAVPGAAVQATATVTFGWPKQGLLFHPARSYCGRLLAVEIGFPPLSVRAPADYPASGRVGRLAVPDGESTIYGAELITADWVRSRLPARPPNSYKSVSGRLMVLAGRAGMAGAAIVAAHAALRAGAGYLWVASVGENRNPLQTTLPEAIFVERADRAALRTALASADAVLIGPGMGVDEAARELLEIVLSEMAGKPALLDADALTLLGRDEEAVRRFAADRELVLTPHPGEMSRLTGLEIDDVVSDPVGVAREFAGRTGCVIVLKGMPSVIAARGAPVLINTVGSSELARAGMGDQLAGVIAALLAAGGSAAGRERLSARTAAGLGLFYAGRAADLAGRGRSLGPRDVSENLDAALAEPGPISPPLGLPFVTFDQPARW
jgi:NAD(P)H-hydrate epimerase